MNAAERATIEGLAARLNPGASTAELVAVARETKNVLLQLAAVKPGGKAAPKVCPAAKAALSVCSKLAGKVESPDAYTQRLRYLDTFSEEEREARAARLDSLPIYAQFSYEGTPKGMKDDAARMWLTGRMEQFEREAREAIERARAKRLRDECDVLQAWAERNRPDTRPIGYYAWRHKPTAQWPREEALAA